MAGQNVQPPMQPGRAGNGIKLRGDEVEGNENTKGRKRGVINHKEHKNSG